MLPTSDSDIRRTFGQRIVAARVDVGLTQREVAEAMTTMGVNTTAQAISQWETGATSPGVKRRLVISQVLGVPSRELFALPDDDEAVA